MSLSFAVSLSFITVKRLHTTILGEGASVRGLQAFGYPLDIGRLWKFESLAKQGKDIRS